MQEIVKITMLRAQTRNRHRLGVLQKKEEYLHTVWRLSLRKDFQGALELGLERLIGESHTDGIRSFSR